MLKLAKGLRELALDLNGRAARAVPGKLPTISRLTQLSNLQIHGIANDVEDSHLTAALARLTQLTRLSLRFDHEEDDFGDWDETDRVVFPWAAAVCGLTNLRQLCITADTDIESDCSGMFRGYLPAAVTNLTALQGLTVLGMDTWQVHSGSNQLSLAALPALETAALHLHTRSAEFPGLSRQRQLVLSRLVSLKLGLRMCAQPGEGYEHTCLPTIIAPALTELSLEDMALAPDSGELRWLPGLPRLRRLVLTHLQTASCELPQGIMACTGLTELVVECVMVMDCSNSESDSSDVHGQAYVMEHLPAAGPYLSNLVRLGLPRNAFFNGVPPSVAAATALEVLDLARQHWLTDELAARVQGLDVLAKLPRLRSVNLTGFAENGAGIQQFRVARPDVRLTF